jgi:NAD(P)-dependent dehydrogenase (short-subunit alcohol dehydrogenase family)
VGGGYEERSGDRDGPCQGIGRHLANRLIADGEQVVDVPPKLSARTRVFATGQGRKTDAHSVALAATRMTRAALRHLLSGFAPHCWFWAACLLAFDPGT